jgi:hypothetical protein
MLADASISWVWRQQGQTRARGPAGHRGTHTLAGGRRGGERRRRRQRDIPVGLAGWYGPAGATIELRGGDGAGACGGGGLGAGGGGESGKRCALGRAERRRGRARWQRETVMRACWGGASRRRRASRWRGASRRGGARRGQAR